eukprot:jgi/Orpsp1_1/1179607/evm.model.c7180000070041.1
MIIKYFIGLTLLISISLAYNCIDLEKDLEKDLKENNIESITCLFESNHIAS